MNFDREAALRVVEDWHKTRNPIAYACNGSVRDLVANSLRAGCSEPEPERPKPKFQVGDRVRLWCSYGNILDRRWAHDRWEYRDDCMVDCETVWMPESRYELAPKPELKVGGKARITCGTEHEGTICRVLTITPAYPAMRGRADVELQSIDGDWLVPENTEPGYGCDIAWFWHGMLEPVED